MIRIDLYFVSFYIQIRHIHCEREHRLPQVNQLVTVDLFYQTMLYAVFDNSESNIKF